MEEAGGIVHGAPDGVVARGDVAATAGYTGMHNSSNDCASVGVTYSSKFEGDVLLMM